MIHVMDSRIILILFCIARGALFAFAVFTTSCSTLSTRIGAAVFVNVLILLPASWIKRVWKFAGIFQQMIMKPIWFLVDLWMYIYIYIIIYIYISYLDSMRAVYKNDQI